MANMARLVLLASSMSFVAGKLTAGQFEMKGSGMTSTDVCKGRSNHCSVKLDVPPACAGDTSSCPIFMKFHAHGGKNGGAATGHKRNFIGIAPQGELYNGKSGWNDGLQDGNKCKWDDFTCTKDPRDGLFVAGIIAAVRELGATGRIYAMGGSNGAQMVQILAANAGDALPISGIAARSGQLLAEPPRSASNPYNWNQPCAGNQPCKGGPAVAQLSFHGDADKSIAYDGGPKFGSKVFTLMSEPASDALWKTQNGCTGKLSSTLIPATGKSPSVHDADYFVWGGCPATAPVEYYKIHGAPHVGGKTVNGTSITNAILDFFCKVEVAHGGKCAGFAGQTSSPLARTAVLV